MLRLSGTIRQAAQGSGTMKEISSPLFEKAYLVRVNAGESSSCILYFLGYNALEKPQEFYCFVDRLGIPNKKRITTDNIGSFVKEYGYQEFCVQLLGSGSESIDNLEEKMLPIVDSIVRK